MDIDIDQIIYWEWDFVRLNATLLGTFIVTFVLLGLAMFIRGRLVDDMPIPRWQHGLEVMLIWIRDMIRESVGEPMNRYVSFIGTLFIFIAASNLLSLIPGLFPPTASLSTAAALAACVFIAVPVYGVASRGLGGYLRQYIHPTPLMLPFQVIGELSRTVALAIRLFGNMMSGMLIVAVLLSIAPLFFPVIMQLFELLIGMIQAYVFAMLALVYIASATRSHDSGSRPDSLDVPLQHT